MPLVAFIIRIYHDARSPERQITETVQIKFGLKISVFINSRDIGMRLQIYCLSPALYRATEINLTQVSEKNLVYFYFSKQK